MDINMIRLKNYNREGKPKMVVIIDDQEFEFDDISCRKKYNKGLSGEYVLFGLSRELSSEIKRSNYCKKVFKCIIRRNDKDVFDGEQCYFNSLPLDNSTVDLCARLINMDSLEM